MRYIKKAIINPKEGNIQFFSSDTLIINDIIFLQLYSIFLIHTHETNTILSLFIKLKCASKNLVEDEYKICVS